jgi:hypothetical protein
MNKTRLITIFATGLLIANVILVCFIFFTPHRPPMHVEPRNIIIDRLHFTQSQVKLYDRLINAHRTAILEKEDAMLRLKNDLYRTLINGNASVIDSIEKEIANIQVEIERTNYRHFRDIGNLCTGEQKTDYANLINDIAEIFARPRPPVGR